MAEEKKLSTDKKIDLLMTELYQIYKSEGFAKSYPSFPEWVSGRAAYDADEISFLERGEVPPNLGGGRIDREPSSDLSQK
jgi:hypothetical protein